MYFNKPIQEHPTASCLVTSRPKRRRSQEGQGVLEFVLVSSSIIFFIFLFINLCYVFIVTQYIDYAVFMAARALNAAHGTTANQQARAQATLNRMLGMQGGGANVFAPLVTLLTTTEQAVQAQAQYPNPKGDGNLVAGVRLEYEVPVFMIPPLGLIRAEDLQGLSRLRLVSETYLDREPTQQECYQYLEGFVDKHFSYLTEAQKKLLVRETSDNGC